MSKFVTPEQAIALRAAKPDSFQRRAYEDIKRRAVENSRFPGLIQPGDPEDWWGMSEHRACDAAFVWHIDRDPALGEWIRGVGLWMGGLEDIDWIGPWFRSHARPLVGQLETSHATAALCYIIDLCGELFSGQELLGLKTTLRNNGMELCRRFCDSVLRSGATLNNWFSVLLLGYGMAALVLEDGEEIGHCLELMTYSQRLYNADSYGETLNYCDFASSVLMRLQEAILCFRPDLGDRLDFDCYARMAVWQAASFLHLKKWDKNDPAFYSRVINFGDCDATYRPRAEMLTHIAARCRTSHPKEAALCSWMFSIFYESGSCCGEETVPYYAVLLYPEMAAPKTPAQLGLESELFFENGHVILRDRWEAPESVVGLRLGYQPLNASTHHHQDFGSFQFVAGQERMVVDGGSCCYRLDSHKFSASSNQHATVDFLDTSKIRGGFNFCTSPYDGVISQKFIDSWFEKPEQPMVRNVKNERVGGIRVIAADMADLYDDNVKKCTRIFLIGLPHYMMIVDMAQTASNLSMRTHFPINNRDGRLSAIRTDDWHYTFSRGRATVKVSEDMCLVDGVERPSALQRDWGYCHKRYSSKPNMDVQGKEGSVEIYNWVDSIPGKEHLRVTTLLNETAAPGWSVQRDGSSCCIFSPNQEKALVLDVGNGWVRISMPGQEDILLMK